MKKINLSILLFFLLSIVNAQVKKECFSKDLIVVAENLNFRNSPNTKSESIDKLENGELLTLIDFYQEGNNDSWFEVKRNSTGQTGYVFSKYVTSQNEAYTNYSNYGNRLQEGNWFGIYQSKKGEVFLEKVSPKISKQEGYSSITATGRNYQLLICSQEFLEEGKIGRLFKSRNEYIKIGTQKELIRIGNNSFSITCTGEVELKGGWLVRKNEKIIFTRTEMNGGQRKYIHQDITNCIEGYGEIGYNLHFVGDLNKDGIPELIISEGDTKRGALYYFMSNQEGELELKSITGSDSRC